MNLSDITKPLTTEELATLSLEQLRERMKLIRVATAKQDWSWSYDEYLNLEQLIPEEKAARDVAWAKWNQQQRSLYG